MKTQILSIFIFLLGSTIQLNAQSQYASAADSDPDAIKMLKKISTDYLSKAAHKIDFTLDIELPGSGMESQKGELIQAGEKFVLDLGSRKIISDTETVWLYLADMNEVQVNDADFDESEEFMSPSDIFSLYESDDFVFGISNYGEEEGKAITQIEGKPLTADSDYSKMRLTVMNKGQKVKRLKIFNKDGSRYTLHINSHDDSYKADESIFSFDESQYEGVHVEDLRF